MHLDRGFSLVDSGLAAPAKIMWTYSFDQLKASADDGNRLLFLDFGEGEIVSIPKSRKLSEFVCLFRFFFHFCFETFPQELDMECCPKPVVFVLHNCLSAKVHSLT